MTRIVRLVGMGSLSLALASGTALAHGRGDRLDRQDRVADRQERTADRQDRAAGRQDGEARRDAALTANGERMQAHADAMDARAATLAGHGQAGAALQENAARMRQHGVDMEARAQVGAEVATGEQHQARTHHRPDLAQQHRVQHAGDDAASADAAP